MKKYWLTLSQDTFLWLKEKEGCVYNTITHRAFSFEKTDVLIPIVDTLLQIQNLYRVSISETQMADVDVKNWVKKLLALKCAKLILDDGMIPPPVSLKPELKIQDTISYYRHTHDQHVDGRLMDNLHKLVIHLNDKNYLDWNYSQQSLFERKDTVLRDYRLLSQFLISMGKPYYLSEVVLVGCLWEYTDYKQLLDFFYGLSIPVSICCEEKDLVNYRKKEYDFIYKKVSFYVLITDYTSIVQLVKDSNVCYQFMIFSEEDYKNAEILIIQYHLENYRMIPIYTGDNLAFFENNIYLSEEELLNINLSKREIFAHQVINTNYFGVLTIGPDGKVYSGDMNEPAIGTIDESLYTIVYREMTEGHSWLRIRDQKTCCDCIYQWLCPSPSNYELAIGKPNLCHVKP